MTTTAPVASGVRQPRMARDVAARLAPVEYDRLLQDLRHIDTEEWSYFLQADSGSVTVETVDGKLKGSASSLTFKEIGDEGGFMEGGCSATIDSVPFDATYVVEEEEPPA